MSIIKCLSLSGLVLRMKLFKVTLPIGRIMAPALIVIDMQNGFV